MPETGLIKVKYVKSSIGYSKRQKDTVRSLGLRKLGDTVVHADSPAIRGMAASVSHLVEVEPVDEVQVVAGEPSGSDES
jgi:large subunit ribosomal protein L30